MYVRSVIYCPSSKLPESDMKVILYVILLVFRFLGRAVVILFQEATSLDPSFERNTD
jgi:hypothetical protein